MLGTKGQKRFIKLAPGREVPRAVVHLNDNQPIFFLHSDRQISPFSANIQLDSTKDKSLRNRINDNCCIVQTLSAASLESP
jgi:hypothetical protein